MFVEHLKSRYNLWKWLFEATPKSADTHEDDIQSADSLKCPYMLAGHASGCWLSVLGAGVQYNREKNESLDCTPHPHRRKSTPV